MSRTSLKSFKQGYRCRAENIQGPHRRLDLAPFWRGEVKEHPRQGFFYWSDDGDLMALRVEQWKVTFAEQRAHGFGVWQEPMVSLRVPKIYNFEAIPLNVADDRCQYVLRQMVGGPSIPARPCPSDRWPVPQDFRGIPAAPKTGQLQHRPGPGESSTKTGEHGRWPI